MKNILLISLLLSLNIALKASNFDIAWPIDTIFKMYVGIYKLDENPMIQTYTVTFENDKLYGQANGYDKTELTKQKDVHHFKSGYGSDVIFMQEAADKPVEKVKLVIQGNEIMATKQ